MSLARLVAELDGAGRSVTLPELATRLGLPPDRVRGMVETLRAAGRLDGSAPPADACGTRRGCAGVCPGPDRCPLVVDLGTGGWMAVTRP